VQSLARYKLTLGAGSMVVIDDEGLALNQSEIEIYHRPALLFFIVYIIYTE
jgi:hypothetical protein